MKGIKKILFTCLAVILVLIVSFMFVPSWVFAQLGIGEPFGGLVLFVVPCPCSGGEMITVGPPRPGIFMVDAGSIVYERFQPFVGHWVLGLSDFYEPCLWPTLFGCVPIGGASRIRILGTS